MKELSEKNLGTCKVCKSIIEVYEDFGKDEYSIYQLIILSCMCGFTKEKSLFKYESDSYKESEISQYMKKNRSDFVSKFIMNRLEE